MLVLFATAHFVEDKLTGHARGDLRLGREWECEVARVQGYQECEVPRVRVLGQKLNQGLGFRGESLKSSN